MTRGVLQTIVTYSDKMPSSEDKVNMLAKAINGSLKKSTFPSGRDDRISPAGLLNSLITPEHIENILNKPGLIVESPDKDLVDFILRKAIKLIAIFLAIDLRGEKLRTTIKSFIRHQKYDRSLPLDHQALKKLDCYDDWIPLQQESFIHYQWRFLAPQFVTKTALERIQFEPKILFPFKLSNSNPPKGGFGTVWRAEVHKPHLEQQKVSIDELLFKICH